MAIVEASDKTRQGAIQKALDKLGVELHDVDDIEILEEGRKGLFGLGARDVVVRLTCEKVKQSAVKQDRPKPKVPKQPPQAKPAKPPKQKASASPARQESKAVDKGKPETTGRKKDVRDLPPAEDNGSSSLLREVITRMGITAEVEFSADDDGQGVLKVESEDSALLIGRKGRTLEALQYLINRMVDRAEGADRLLLDIGGYLERRRETLQQMALDLAAKAKETKRRMRMKPMNPQERRMVHVALEDDPDVRTFSVGNSLHRSVIIAPNDEPERESGGNNRGRGGRSGRRGGRGRGRGSRGPRQEKGAPSATEAS